MPSFLTHGDAALASVPIILTAAQVDAPPVRGCFPIGGCVERIARCERTSNLVSRSIFTRQAERACHASCRLLRVRIYVWLSLLVCISAVRACSPPRSACRAHARSCTRARGASPLGAPSRARAVALLPAARHAPAERRHAERAGLHHRSGEQLGETHNTQLEICPLRCERVARNSLITKKTCAIYCYGTAGLCFWHRQCDRPPRSRRGCRRVLRRL